MPESDRGNGYCVSCQVAGFYSWRQIAERTARVYDDVTASTRDDSTLARLRRAAKCALHSRSATNIPQFCCVAQLFIIGPTARSRGCGAPPSAFVCTEFCSQNRSELCSLHSINTICVWSSNR